MRKELISDGSRLPSSGGAFGEKLAIFLSITLVYTGFSAAYLFISLFLLQQKNAPLPEIGIIYLATGGIDILVQTIGGRLSDRLGTKTVMSVGLLGSAAIYFLFILFILTDSPVFLYIATFPILGLFGGLFQLALSSYVSDREKDEMAGGLSQLYVGLNFGFTIGPITGGFVISYLGYSYLFLMGLLTSVAAIFVIMLGVMANPKYAERATETQRLGKTKIFRRKGVFTLLILVFVSWFVISYQAVPLSIFESKFLVLTSIEIGIVLSTNGFLITVFQVPISKLIRVEEKGTLIPIALGSAIMAAGYAIISFSHTFLPMILAIAITTLGEMMIAVPTQVVITLFSKSHNRGQYQGYYFAFSRGGASFSSFAGLLLFSYFLNHAQYAWYIVILIALLAAMAYSILSPTIMREYSAFSKQDLSN